MVGAVIVTGEAASSCVVVGDGAGSTPFHGVFVDGRLLVFTGQAVRQYTDLAVLDGELAVTEAGAQQLVGSFTIVNDAVVLTLSPGRVVVPIQRPLSGSATPRRLASTLSADLLAPADVLANVLPITLDIVQPSPTTRSLKVTRDGVVNSFPLFGGPLNTAGDGVRASLVDANGVIVVGGSAGLLLNAIPGGNIVNRGSPRDGRVRRFLADAGGDHIWAIADNAVLYWSRESARAGFPADARVAVADGERVGGVALTLAGGPPQLIVRDDREALLLVTLVAPNELEVEPLVDENDAPILASSGEGDLGFIVGSSAQRLIEVVRPTGTDLTVLVRDYVVQQLPVVASDSTREILGPCNTTTGCVVAAAVAPGGTKLVVAQRGSAATDIALSRCAVSVGAGDGLSFTCDSAAGISLGTDDDARVGLRVDDAGVVVGAAAGEVLRWLPEGQPAKSNLSGATARQIPRHVGTCLYTARRQQVASVVIGGATPTTKNLDGVALDVISVDASTLLVGGGESVDGVGTAAQLYRVFVDGQSCAFSQTSSDPLGHERSQADVVGIGAFNDGRVVVGDSDRTVWLVPPR
jgi:hypothetical protein